MQGIEAELSLRRNPGPAAQPGLLPMLRSYPDVHSWYSLPKTSVCRCAICELEVWLQGEIAVIGTDMATKETCAP
jgi:hypothetical protein